MFNSIIVISIIIIVPPGPLECIRGRMRFGNGVFLSVCLGKISRESTGKGCFVEKTQNKIKFTNFRDRGFIMILFPEKGGGVRVMGNVHIGTP